MKTYVPKASEIERKWLLVDAKDQVVGRIATQIAALLRGKHKAEYSPFQDTGDFVIVINADKVRLTGNKEQQKVYRRHSGYMGGLKEVSYQNMMEKHPERIIEKAVKGMLPHNSLGRQMYRKLKVYAGPDHPHAAQQPEVYELD